MLKFTMREHHLNNPLYSTLNKGEAVILSDEGSIEDLCEIEYNSHLHDKVQLPVILLMANAKTNSVTLGFSTPRKLKNELGIIFEKSIDPNKTIIYAFCSESNKESALIEFQKNLELLKVMIQDEIMVSE